jgi:EpsI family protein
MSWAVRSIVVLALLVASWQVHRVRAQLSREDADPVIVAALTKRLASLPLTLDGGRYRGERVRISDQMADQSGADIHETIDYTDENGNSIRLYIGGSIKNQENFHAPSYCMPGAGWEIVEQGTSPFRAYEVAGASMRRLLLQYGSQQMVVYYWFQAGPRIASHEWTIRYYRFLDLLASEPLRPTLIVTVYATVFRSVADTETGVANFLRAVGPSLREIMHEGDA